MIWYVYYIMYIHDIHDNYMIITMLHMNCVFLDVCPMICEMRLESSKTISRLLDRFGSSDSWNVHLLHQSGCMHVFPGLSWNMNSHRIWDWKNLGEPPGGWSWHLKPSYLGVGTGQSWSKEIAVRRRCCATPQTSYGAGGDGTLQRKLLWLHGSHDACWCTTFQWTWDASGCLPLWEATFSLRYVEMILGTPWASVLQLSRENEWETPLNSAYLHPPLFWPGTHV